MKSCEKGSFTSRHILTTNGTKKTHAIICWFFPTKENWPRNFCRKPGMAVCMFCMCSKDGGAWLGEYLLIGGILCIAPGWLDSIILISSAQQLFMVFLPKEEYLNDEWAGRYLKYKFLSLCTVCSGIFNIIVQIKTRARDEKLQGIPSTNICSESTMWKVLRQVLRILGSEEKTYESLSSLFTV